MIPSMFTPLMFVSGEIVFDEELMEEVEMSEAENVGMEILAYCPVIVERLLNNEVFLKLMEYDEGFYYDSIHEDNEPNPLHICLN